ncbi:MAG: hypothetical protein JW929_16670, partial [Anaerolineales bacterium]|nr:hypothetical protein [Anaerolineales bacterium]
LRSSSQVLCWGNNQYGELGDGTSSNRNLPVYVNVITHSGDEVLQLAAGRHHTCARMNVNRVRCWGNNQFGQLGDGTNLASALPCTANTGGADISVIATGSWHTCAGTSQGEVLCWGKNTYGQLGNGTNTDSNTPVESLGAGESSAR